MAVFRQQFKRMNFDFDPPLQQTADVVFEVDAEDCSHTCCIPWYRGGIRRRKCLTCGTVL